MSGGYKGEDLSSTPIVLERWPYREALHGYPSHPTMLNAHWPYPSALAPPTKIPDTMDSMWHLMWSGKHPLSLRGLSFGKGSWLVSKTERNGLISPAFEVGFRSAKNLICKEGHRDFYSDQTALGKGSDIVRHRARLHMHVRFFILPHICSKNFLLFKLTFSLHWFTTAWPPCSSHCTLTAGNPCYAAWL